MLSLVAVGSLWPTSGLAFSIFVYPVIFSFSHCRLFCDDGGYLSALNVSPISSGLQYLSIYLIAQNGGAALCGFLHKSS